MSKRAVEALEETCFSWSERLSEIEAAQDRVFNLRELEEDEEIILIPEEATLLFLQKVHFSKAQKAFLSNFGSTGFRP